MVVFVLEWPWHRANSIECLKFLTSYAVKLANESLTMNMVDTIAFINMRGLDTRLPLKLFDLLMQYCREVLLLYSQFQFLVDQVVIVLPSNHLTQLVG